MPRLRPSIIFNRGELTDWLLANLSTPGPDGPVLIGSGFGEELAVLLGDGMAPPAGGWPGGEPNPSVDTFVPYTVLATTPANPSPGTPVGSAEADSWDCGYAITSYGSLRQQADWVADLVRVTWGTLPAGNLEFGSDRVWHVGNFRVAQMGAVTRNDQLNPPLWEAPTAVTLTISRQHGSAA